ncbi:MAG: hypothetical protein WCA19_24065 [Candidatus Acidiferrales bacterium]
MSKPDYKEFVKQAEAAVASIKDGDLKAIAFGKILDTLLGQGGGPTEQGRVVQSNRGAGTKRRSTTATKPAKKRSGPKGHAEE